MDRPTTVIKHRSELYYMPLNLRAVPMRKDGTYEDIFSVESLIKSGDRVKSNGEVFTPNNIVNDMMDMLDKEDNKSDFESFKQWCSEADTESLLKYLDRTCMEPSCGNGNFLVEILRRKLMVATQLSKTDSNNMLQYYLKCFTTIYGIDIDEQNVIEAKQRMYLTFVNYLKSTADAQSMLQSLSYHVIQLVYYIMEVNIQLGNMLTGKYVMDDKVNYGTYQREVNRTAKMTYNSVTEKYELSNTQDLLITDWKFSADKVQRQTFRINDMSNDEEQQEPYNRLGELVGIYFGNQFDESVEAVIGQFNGGDFNMYSEHSNCKFTIDQVMSSETVSTDNKTVIKTNSTQKKAKGVQMMTNW
jgi:hypothetical protein